MDRAERSNHPVANALGAALRGARSGDEQVRRRLQGWIAFLLSGGLSVWIAVSAWRLGEEAIRRTWAVQDGQIAALITEIRDLVVEVRALSSDRKGDRR